jgi:hypothetical protein
VRTDVAATPMLNVVVRTEKLSDTISHFEFKIIKFGRFEAFLILFRMSECPTEQSNQSAAASTVLPLHGMHKHKKR